jgi:hypothetical protein
VPRAISMRQTVVPAGDRDEFLARAGRSRAHYTGRGCQYWIFEEATLPGAYVEFFEAKDRHALLEAHGDAPQPILESARMYVEVELT